MKLTATVTVSGIMDAGKVYEGAILRSPDGTLAFYFYSYRMRDWWGEPLYRFVPVGEYLNEGTPNVPASGAQ